MPLGGAAAPTGVWFAEQTPAAVADAIERFEANADAFDPAHLRQHALRFAVGRFADELFGLIAGRLGGERALPRAA